MSTRFPGKYRLMAVGAALAAASAMSAGPASAADQAPLRGTDNDSALKGKYVVVLKRASSAPSVLGDLLKQKKVSREYHGALRGFAANLDSSALKRVRKDPQVAYVEADAVVKATATQTGATWGLDRIDQRALPLNQTYTVSGTASNVTAFVIDTGIRASHKDFGGRVGGGFSAIAAGGTDDCNGHGTHVAGTIGSATYGVAKGVKLVPVRVLGCDGSGTTAGVVAGIDWVTSHHSGPSVANMSLGGGVSSAIDDAVTRSINSGVSYAVAAGNSSFAACLSSPARVPGAITVGASTASDSTAGFSNWGSCIDLFAPGDKITSAWNTSDTATNTISGTSMASPHAAGAAALYLASHTTATPAAVQAALVADATPGKLSWVLFGSPNKLLHVS